MYKSYKISYKWMNNFLKKNVFFNKITGNIKLLNHSHDQTESKHT